MFQYGQGLICLLEDGQELVGGESSADIQLGETAIELVENARIVPGDVEYLKALKLLKVVVERVDQHLLWSYEDVEGVGGESERGL